MKAKPVHLKNSLGGVAGTSLPSDASSSKITSLAGKKLFRSLSFSRRNSISASEAPDGPATTSPARLPSKKLARKFSFDLLKPSGTSSSSTGIQKEASGASLDILQLAFSPTGDYLAALVQPIAAEPSSSSQSSYEALLGIVAGHRGEVHQPAETVESSEKYVIVYTTRGEQLEPLVMINDQTRFKREKGAVPCDPCPSQHIAFGLLTLRLSWTNACAGAPISLGWQSGDALLVYFSSRDAALTRRAGTVEHTVPWGSSAEEQEQEKRRDCAISLCPAKQQQAALRWPPSGMESPGVLVDAATTPALVALAFRWVAPLPGYAGGGGSVKLLSQRLELLATLPLDVPPAFISLGTDHSQAAPQAGFRGRSRDCLLTLGFEQGGVEVSRISPDHGS